MDHYAEFYVENAQSKAEAKTWGWVSFSGILHTALAVAVMTFSFEMITPDKPELIEFEVAPVDSAALISAPAAAELPAPPSAPPAVAEAPPIAQAEETVAPPSPMPVKVKEVPQELPAKKVAAQPVKPAPAPAPVKAVAPVAVVQKESPVVVKALDDSEVEETLKKTPTMAAANLDEKHIDEDLDEVDQQDDGKVAAAKADMDRETEDALKEKDDKIAAVEKEQKEEATQLAAIAAQKRAEREAAEKAYVESVVAKQRADDQAAEAKLAAEVAAAHKAASEKASSDKTGGGGVSEVRALEELRQMPGNKKPAYETEDRLAQRQGDVAYIAYVSKDGNITQVKMMKSTGHRSLDLKTLKAIQSWKFYPGQEGWVEIPFRWDLKGGPQEMPATLRRRISQK